MQWKNVRTVRSELELSTTFLCLKFQISAPWTVTRLQTSFFKRSLGITDIFYPNCSKHPSPWEGLYERGSIIIGKLSCVTCLSQSTGETDKALVCSPALLLIMWHCVFVCLPLCLFVRLSVYLLYLDRSLTHPILLLISTSPLMPYYPPLLFHSCLLSHTFLFSILSLHPSIILSIVSPSTPPSSSLYCLSLHPSLLLSIKQS